MLDLFRDTLFVTLAGSQAHGTAREGSDVDLRGVCIAPLDVRLSLFHEFEQFEGVLEGPLWDAVRPALERHPTASRGMALKTETVIFDLAKFLRLCTAANPNALEVLFADEADWLYATPEWARLHAERHRFLTRKVQATYLGYALAQLKKIEAHRESHRLQRSGRNSLRAELERRHGYDTKHALHLVRLMRTGLELLETGELRVRRSDAAELNAIRDGALPFDALQELATELQQRMVEAARSTSLPADVDHGFVDRLAVEMLTAPRPRPVPRP